MTIALLGLLLGAALAVLAFVTPRECCPDRAGGLRPQDVEILRVQAREATRLPSLRLQLEVAGRDTNGRLAGTLSHRTAFGVEYARTEIRAGSVDYRGQAWAFAAVWIAFAFAEAGMAVLVLVALTGSDEEEPAELTASGVPH